MRVVPFAVLIVGAIVASIVGWPPTTVLAQGAGAAVANPPPAWNPPGGTITPPPATSPNDPYTATGKSGEVYVWDPKRCRWTYRDKSGPNSPFEHPACGASGQGLPFGTKSTSPDGSTAAENASNTYGEEGAGSTYTYDGDTFDNHGNVTKAGKGWVNDKTGASLCTPPKTAGVMPGGGGSGSCIKQNPSPYPGWHPVPMDTTPGPPPG